jgi:hypothetical protein
MLICRMKIILLLVSLLLAQDPSARGIGAGLRPGMRLVYGSGEQLQEPWMVDSVRVAVPLRASSDCAVIHQRRTPLRPEEMRLCVARDTLYRWRATDSTWVISRPVGPSMTWTSARAAGGSVEYATSALAVDTISGFAIPVVPTVVTTRDSTGRAIRRLTERYAPGLATATGGTFEEADLAGGWRVSQVFALREIR